MCTYVYNMTYNLRNHMQSQNSPQKVKNQAFSCPVNFVLDGEKVFGLVGHESLGWNRWNREQIRPSPAARHISTNQGNQGSSKASIPAGAAQLNPGWMEMINCCAACVRALVYKSSYWQGSGEPIKRNYMQR